jgi:hypothetical protein
MKKIAISLIAFAAISTAALASGNRNWDLQDSPDNLYQFSGHPLAPFSSSNGFTAGTSERPPTNFELMKRNQEKNELEDH